MLLPSVVDGLPVLAVWVVLTLVVLTRLIAIGDIGEMGDGGPQEASISGCEEMGVPMVQLMLFERLGGPLAPRELERLGGPLPKPERIMCP